ncbi:unnamed protein product [Prunus armeniaca]|uniref:Uncharacterized protein n=1 Tax=Prunus armeniaca TaxID=36596 RepID=A0A6J5WGT7_PRUAR|nr:unnamed protein product [Prunus armeniaca]
MRVLRKKDEHTAVDDMMCERATREVQKLKYTLKESDTFIKALTDEKKANRILHDATNRRLHKEKYDLARMSQVYPGEMQQKMDEVERANKRVQDDQEKM